MCSRQVSLYRGNDKGGGDVREGSGKEGGGLGGGLGTAESSGVRRREQGWARKTLPSPYGSLTIRVPQRPWDGWAI